MRFGCIHRFDTWQGRASAHVPESLADGVDIKPYRDDELKQ